MGGFAWVTLATNDSYSLGALVLAHSLKRVGTKYDLAVLVTPGVTAPMREKLASVFSLVQEVNVLDSKDEANLALLARPELGITFTKLHCWRLTQYEKCVFVDADTLVIRNCDELFEREELSAAPDVGWPDCFNSGVFVFTPSQQTFASITSFAAAKGSFDGGDQGLLNQYFSDWSHKDISKHLPFIYNMCSTATYSYLPAFKQFGDDVRIIHFIGITKPWLQYFDTLSGQVQPAPGSNHLQPLLQLWWNIFCENVHPQLSPVMASSTLASVWHELNPLPSVHSFPRTFHQDVADFTYDVTESREPDFSEFQDPWDNYTQESHFPFALAKEPGENYHESSHYHSSQNDSFEPKFAPVFHWEESGKHDEYKQPSVLDSRQNNESQDNNQINHEAITDQRIPEIATDHSHDHHHYKETNNQPQKSCWIHDNNHEKVNHHENQGKRNVEQKYHSDDHSNYYHEQDNRCAEQINHIPQQVFRHDEQNNIVDEKQEHQHHDHSFGSEQYQRDDNFHHEKEENHQYYHDHRETDRESTFTQCNVMNEENKRQIEHDRLQVPSNIDRNEKQTDVCKTKYHSPPEPCTKSKSIATQSEPNIAGQLESNDAGIAGALAKITLGEARSPEQVAFEEHMRKQSWEQGQIDYMGRDSFENIWKKISETLGVQPQRQPSPPKTVAKPEQTETAVVLPVATEDEPEAKSEAAVLPEIRQKEEQDLICELVPALSKLSSPNTSLTSEEKIAETVPPQSIITDAAVTTVALMQTVPQQSPMESIETPLSKKNDSDKSIITAATTTTTVSSIPQTSENLPQDVKLEEKSAKADFLETPAAASIISEASKTSEPTSSEIVQDSPVPIQVAESVLEAEVKESVTEDLRPVTEEAISSISELAQEPVPAILETTMQVVEPANITPNGSTGLETGIGNGIDAPSLSTQSIVTSSVRPEVIPGVIAPLQTQEVISSVRSEEACTLPVRPVESAPETVTVEQKIEICSLPAESIESLPEASSVEKKGETCSLPVKSIESLPEASSVEKKRETCSLPVKSIESLPEATSVEEKVETCSLPVTSIESLPEATPVEKKEEICSLPVKSIESLPEATCVEKKEETCSLPVRPAESLPEATSVCPKEDACSLPAKSLDKEKCSPSIVEPLEKSAETKLPAEQKNEKPEGVKLLVETAQASEAEAKQPAALPVEPEILRAGSNVTKTEETKDIEKLAETKLSAIEEPRLPAAETTLPPKPKLTVCPMKPGRKNPEIELPINIEQSKTDAALTAEESVKKKVPKDETNVASEETTSESSEESPIRPARTKDITIPGTPIVIAATPPTSPPIGAVESFEDQPTKATKKVVKKVVKKTTTGEGKTAEGAEGDADGKKVTKKVVKKVVKKTKEDDPTAAESSSGNEKPKKIVKVVKKTTKSSQSLETDTTVPETPPPGTSEIPVPPKRKLKTTAKTIPAKTDSEP